MNQTKHPTKPTQPRQAVRTDKPYHRHRHVKSGRAKRCPACSWSGCQCDAADRALMASPAGVALRRLAKVVEATSFDLAAVETLDVADLIEASR